MTGSAIVDNSDLPEHRVAVVVFTTVRAVDELDALNIAEAAVRGVIREAPGRFIDPHAKSIVFAKGNWRVDVVVHSVAEVGRAALNGELAVSLTPKVYRDASEGR